MTPSDGGFSVCRTHGILLLLPLVPRGLITVNSSMTYLIEPLAGRGGLWTSRHAIYRAEHLQLPKGTCGHRHNHTAQVLEDLIHGKAQAPPSGRVSRCSLPPHPESRYLASQAFSFYSCRKNGT